MRCVSSVIRYFRFQVSFWFAPFLRALTSAPLQTSPMSFSRLSFSSFSDEVGAGVSTTYSSTCPTEVLCCVDKPCLQPALYPSLKPVLYASESVSASGTWEHTDAADEFCGAGKGSVFSCAYTARAEAHNTISRKANR